MAGKKIHTDATPLLWVLNISEDKIFSSIHIQRPFIYSRSSFEEWVLCGIPWTRVNFVGIIGSNAEGIEPLDIMRQGQRR